MSSNHIEFECRTYFDFDDNFLPEITRNRNHKIYILDIVTPTRSGIDAARLIRNKDMESVIIFLAGNDEFSNIVAKKVLMSLTFINKFDNAEQTLKKALEKAIYVLNNKLALKFKDKYNNYMIDYKEILYITKDTYSRMTIIKTDNCSYMVNNPLSELKELLSDDFVQSHKACIINLSRVRKIDKKNRVITFDNDETVDLLSDKYKKDLVGIR
jgi:DNA-binding LytR/AlgR family response regulator